MREIGTENSSSEIININTEQGDAQKLRAFYRFLNTKPDTLTKKFTRLNQYDLDDIEEIHNKILQISGTYTIAEKSFNITIGYVDKKSHTVSESFEDFKKISSSGTEPTKFVTLEYNFLMNPEKNDAAANKYKITININSDLASDSTSSFMWRNFWDTTTGQVKIEHVDYVIAQNFMKNITEWFNSVEAVDKNKIITFAQRASQFIPSLLVVLFTILFAYQVYQVVEIKLINADFVIFSKFLIFTITLGIVIRLVSDYLGYFIVRCINSFDQLSYISLNKGDKNLIKKAKEKNKRNVLRIIASVISSVVFSLVVYECRMLIFS